VGLHHDPRRSSGLGLNSGLSGILVLASFCRGMSRDDFGAIDWFLLLCPLAKQGRQTGSLTRPAGAWH